MKIALVLALCIAALAGGVGFGFLLGRRTAATHSGRGRGKIHASDRDIVL